MPDRKEGDDGRKKQRNVGRRKDKSEELGHRLIVIVAWSTGIRYCWKDNRKRAPFNSPPFQYCAIM